MQQACPLCADTRARPSWLGSCVFMGREFPYAQCDGCGTLYCDPMPGPDVLAQIYGTHYVQSFADGVTDPKEPGRVIRWLETVPPGTFLDYGCGEGALLAEAARRNWRPVGVEYDPEVARQTAERTGAEVMTVAEVGKRAEPVADVLHLGDVIEHLTELDRQMPAILRLLKPGGLLLAQGPLEAGACLFTLLVRLGRWARRRPPIPMSPGHVLLATADGQRVFFRRHGLDEVEYVLSEVDWPAPSRLSAAEMRRPRAVGLFLARRLSRALTRLRPDRWGNRYFFAGRRSLRPQGLTPLANDGRPSGANAADTHPDTAA